MTSAAVLHHELDGETGKPVLLMVHGLLSSRNHWLENASRLRARFRLLRVDLPGHGLSAPAPPELLHPDRLMLALEKVRAQHGIDRLGLCGQSFGTGLILRYALAYPERVIGLVFTNANAALNPPDPAATRARLASRIAGLRRDGAAALLAEPVHPRRASRFSPTLRATLVADAAAMRAEAYADLLEYGLPHMGLGERLREVRVPSLLVNGLWERRFQPTRAVAAEMIPDLRIVDLEGGHSINAERPADFDASTLEFFAGLG